jgi:hypothetical protein
LINWQLIGCYNKPDGWDESAPDGVYGDVEALEQSCNAGEQQIIYLLRRSAQGEKLAEFRGTSDGTPQAPHELGSMEEELSPASDDAAWE